MPRERLLGGETVVVDGPEGRHAADVRRLVTGEAVRLVDGSGIVVDGVVRDVRKGALTVEVRKRAEVAAPQPRVVVVQALAKGEHADRAVDAMTEIGVDEIVPWAAQRSVVQWRDDRAEKSRQRWESVAHAAAKQSRRTHFPVVADLAQTADVVTRIARAALAVVCHESAGEPLSAVEPPESGDLLVVIGPEGGLTDDELATFAAAGAPAYRLGPTVLRTSTAGVVAATVLLSRTARWAPVS